MTSFRFSLQKVLDWRRTQLDLAEARYKQQAAALAELDRAHGEIETAGGKAEASARPCGAGWQPAADCQSAWNVETPLLNLSDGGIAAFFKDAGLCRSLHTLRTAQSRKSRLHSRSPSLEDQTVSSAQ